MPGHTDLLETAAQALQSLLPQLVFVGGATVEFLLTDEAAAPVRVTKDVDVITRVERRHHLDQLEAQLLQLGFQPDPDGPRCRWLRGDLMIDLMTDDSDMQGFTNPWYRSAIEHAVPQKLPSGQVIRMLDAVHLVATKLVAWADRGQRSLLSSHDLEDILLVIDGRPELEQELRAASPAIRTFITGELNWLLDQRDFADTLEGTLQDQERAQLVLERVRRLADSG